MLRRPTDQLVIRPRLSPRARLALVAAILATVVAAALAGYWGGRRSMQTAHTESLARIARLEERLQQRRAEMREQQEAAGEDRARLAAELRATREQMQTRGPDLDALRAELRARRDALAQARQRLAETRSSLSKVTRQLQVDRTAYQTLREELESSRARISELAGELALYRSIISPADGRSGVRIRELNIKPGPGSGEYRYRLLLIQSLEHQEPVAGRVELEISGARDGESSTVGIPRNSDDAVTTEFRYFRNIVGSFSLPAGFMPAEIEVIFEGGDDTVVRRTFPWPQDPGQDIDLQ